MTQVPWVNDVLRGRTPRWNEVGASPDDVLDLCSALEISGLVHHHVSRERPASDWPADVRRELERRSRTAAARDMIRAREIAYVLDALAADHVFPIILKGSALAHTVYDSPPMRPRVDTDFLIARDQIPTTRDVLTRCGYIESPMSDGELVFCQFQMTKVDAFGVDHVFDVHWRISTQTLFADLLTYAELQAEALAVPRLGPHARTASGPHALLLACVHPVMHHRHADRFIWLRDIDLLVRRLSEEERRRFAHLAISKRMARICVRQLSTACERLDTRVPSDLLQRLTSATDPEPAAIYLHPHRRWHQELFWNVRNLKGWRDRLRLLREVLFPGARYMLGAYHLGACGAVLLPALYLHRCAYGAFKILVGRK